MHLLSLFLTLSTLLLLTTQTPISKDLSARDPSKAKFEFPSLRVPRKADILIVNNKSGGCDLKLINMFDCDATVTIDKTRKWEELPKDKEYKGKVCGKGQWTVKTKYGVRAKFDNGVDSTVSCMMDPKTRGCH